MRIPVGHLDDAALKRLAAKGLAKWNFDPDEPRIPKGDPLGGEWTTGGDGGGGSDGEGSGGGDDGGPDDSTSFVPGPEALLADFSGADSGESELELDAPPRAGAPSDTSSGSAPATSSDGPPIKWEMMPFIDTASGGSQNSGTADGGQTPGPIAAFVGEAPSWLAGDLTPATEDALQLLLGRLAGPTAIFGTLFIPTNGSPVAEGQIAGIADLSYRYDGDTGVLQLLQNIGSLGSVVVDQGHIGLDGLFRDAAGNVIGRSVSGSGVVIDVGTLPGYGTLSDTDQDRPKLCPDPNAENITGRSERSLAYQEQVSGLPRGLEVTLNGVRFDGCIETDGTMLEAKGPGFANKMDGPDDWQGWFTGDEKLEDQMQRQSDAVEGSRRKVEWHFAEQPVADFFRAYVEKYKLNNIVVIYTPPRRP